MRKLRIVFMGTPDFAVATLEALLRSKFNVVGVITAPDRPAGRGRKLQQSAVKKFALDKNLPILQPTNLKSEEFISELNALNANLQIVVAFRMLPSIVWKMPEFGTFNLHASLLPEYRGAAPINWAIINGETKTGVSTFYIDEKIDTGNIILQEEVNINDDDTVGELHDKLMAVGSRLVVKTANLIAKSKVETQKQPKREHKTAPKLFPQTCTINWDQSLNDIYNLIRGLNPYPTARTTLVNGSDKIQVKIYDVKKVFEKHSIETGRIVLGKKELKVAVKDGFLLIETLQLSGKRKMKSTDLLNGFKIQENAIFE
jgi:methionyl-tRNA formyltransferase